MIEKIVQTAKQAVKAMVESHKARPCSPLDTGIWVSMIAASFGNMRDCREPTLESSVSYLIQIKQSRELAGARVRA
jgi:hypothetical protein